MKKLKQVEDAKALMNEAMQWSVFKWLWEKRRVREVADEANAALDRMNRRVKAQWSDQFRNLYRELPANTTHAEKRSSKRNGEITGNTMDSDRAQTIQHIKNLDVKAHSARMDAEKTFDVAETQLSTELARQGCKKAIHSWELHEKAIREAEALVDVSSPNGQSNRGCNYETHR